MDLLALSENPGHLFSEPWDADACGSTEAGLCCSKRRPPSVCFVTQNPDPPFITKDSSRDCSSSANAMAALALQPRLAVLLAVGLWGQTTAGAYDTTVCGQMGYTIPFNNMTCMSPLFIQPSLNTPVPVSLSSCLVRHAILASFSSHA